VDARLRGQMHFFFHERKSASGRAGARPRSRRQTARSELVTLGSACSRPRREPIVYIESVRALKIS
jgi:hypothetical protein